ncbi:MAG TPA: cytochrome P450 [Albitalea sp.]|nr:cytochrome P450 [Albitalea sp.]
MSTIDPGAAAAVRRIADLPGPPGLPLIGNLLQVDRERLHRHAEAWARDYGEAYRFRLASREFVVMSNPEAVATVLRDRPDGFQRTQRLHDIAHGMGSASSPARASASRSGPSSVSTRPT